MHSCGSSDSFEGSQEGCPRLTQWKWVGLEPASEHSFLQILEQLSTKTAWNRPHYHLDILNNVIPQGQSHLDKI